MKIITTSDFAKAILKQINNYRVGSARRDNKNKKESEIKRYK
jgi:hypothetical protein